MGLAAVGPATNGVRSIPWPGGGGGGPFLPYQVVVAAADLSAHPWWWRRRWPCTRWPAGWRRWRRPTPSGRSAAAAAASPSSDAGSGSRSQHWSRCPAAGCARWRGEVIAGPQCFVWQGSPQWSVLLVPTRQRSTVGNSDRVHELASAAFSENSAVIGFNDYDRHAHGRSRRRDGDHLSSLSVDPTALDEATIHPDVGCGNHEIAWSRSSCARGSHGATRAWDRRWGCVKRRLERSSLPGTIDWDALPTHLTDRGADRRESWLGMP